MQILLILMLLKTVMVHKSFRLSTSTSVMSLSRGIMFKYCREYHEEFHPYSGTSDKPIIYASAKQNRANHYGR